MGNEFKNAKKTPKTRINTEIFWEGGLVGSPQKGLYIIEKKDIRIKRLNGVTMFTILFALFLMVVGITIGITYSAFQNTATSSGIMTFAVNGHQGAFTLSNTKVASYNSQDLTITFTLSSDTGYTAPNISAMSMGGATLTKDGNNFKSGSNVVATYSAPTLTIYRALVTGNLSIVGSSTVNTYTVTIAKNNNSYGSVTQSSVTGVPYGSIITTNNDAVSVNGSTITATPTDAIGYTTKFIGWSNPARVVGATTVTANFTRTANTYAVSLDTQGADISGTTSNTATYNSAMPSITLPTKYGCEFLGYFTAQNGKGTKYYNSDGTSATTYTLTDPLTLYANWKWNCIKFSSISNFTITSNAGNGGITWKQADGTTDGRIDYSLDGTTWVNNWDGSALSTSNATRAIWMRGTGNTIITGSGNYQWVLTGSAINCEGNMEALLDYATVMAGNHPTMGAYCYSMMFYECTSLISAPELPAVTLSDYCYGSMFSGCSSLIRAPSLPATVIPNYAYKQMFVNCISLKIAPAFASEITSLGTQCMMFMFSNCTALEVLPYFDFHLVNSPGSYACRQMFVQITPPATTDSTNRNLLLRTGSAGGSNRAYLYIYQYLTPDEYTDYYTTYAVIMPDGTILPATA